jgi:hypothetical protein
MQTTNTILMIKPIDFSFNEQTAVDNEFQNKPEQEQVIINQKANQEFENMVKTLKDNGINILVLDKKLETNVPDAVFPNNWISTEKDGTIITYPMATPNRRAEKNYLPDVKNLLVNNGFDIKNVINIGKTTEDSKFLEGTGSMIFDHAEKIVYISKSIRSDIDQLDNFMNVRSYKKSVIFSSTSSNNKPVYHTNVVMSIGTKFAIICLESIKDKKERKKVKDSLEKHHQVIEISIDQMEKSFCGNILEVKNNNDESLIVMSERAFNGFTNEQKEILSNFGKILPINLQTIEDVGGGSARCMMAEIFCPKKKGC